MLSVVHYAAAQSICSCMTMGCAMSDSKLLSTPTFTKKFSLGSRAMLPPACLLTADLKEAAALFCQQEASVLWA